MKKLFLLLFLPLIMHAMLRRSSTRLLATRSFAKTKISKRLYSTDKKTTQQLFEDCLILMATVENALRRGQLTDYEITDTRTLLFRIQCVKATLGEELQYKINRLTERLRLAENRKDKGLRQDMHQLKERVCKLEDSTIELEKLD